jgi:hypothetical protein
MGGTVYAIANGAFQPRQTVDCDGRQTNCVASAMAYLRKAAQSRDAAVRDEL